MVTLANKGITKVKEKKYFYCVSFLFRSYLLNLKFKISLERLHLKLFLFSLCFSKFEMHSFVNVVFLNITTTFEFGLLKELNLIVSYGKITW